MDQENNDELNEILGDSREFLLNEFLDESREYLSGIENDLIEIEEAKENVNEKTINKVFRAAHSIKGGSSLFGLKKIQELSHKTETVLDLIRLHKLVPNSEIISILLGVFDILRAMINHSKESSDIDISEYLSSLNAISAPFSPPEKNGKISQKEDVSPEKMNNQASALVDASNEIESGSENAQSSENLSLISEFPQDSPEATFSLPTGPQTSEQGQNLPQTSAMKLFDELSSPKSLPENCEKLVQQNTSSGSESSLRVSVNILETLMNLTGELVLSRNQLRDAVSIKDQASIETASQKINLVTSELQEIVMQTRMQPIGNVFSKFPRLIRDLAKDLKKEVQLFIEGHDVEMDKTLIEGLMDPLTHMVRNAVDHGIETVEKRKELGKNPLGSIKIKAFHEAGQVVIELSDDGKGIDPKEVASNAISKGLIPQDLLKGMAEKDKIALILLPGLSTANNVTDLSGRGVGMDVVKTNLDKLGGKIEIESKLGQGSIFRIKLPLTLAIIPSLIISESDEYFAIPQINVIELIRIPAEQANERIELFGNAEVLDLRGKLIPIVEFAKVLGIAKFFANPSTGEKVLERRIYSADRRSIKMAVDKPFPPTNENEREILERRRTSGRRYHASSDLNIAVISTGIIQYGLIVDQLHNTEEIVVKPLGRYLKKLPEYAGATIMGNGQIALILDASGLASKAKLYSVSGSVRAAQAVKESQPEKLQDSHSFLMFSNAPGENCAIPLDLVLRIEKIIPAQIEYVGSRRTMQYRGGSLPLLALNDVTKMNRINDDQEMAVIITSIDAREIGLLGTMPVDVIEAEMDIDQSTLKQKGIMGSIVIRDKTILLIDIIELMENIYPEWAIKKTKSEAESNIPLILLAEDSNFFRGQLKKIIENAGYKVIEAPDGQKAWQLLEEYGEKIKILVTDIEMPELSGIGLAQKIRKDSKLSSLPIIAVTSLAEEDDIARGKAAGIDDYQIKLDRKTLISRIDYYFKSNSDI
ncbi:MAG: chemotaxis protein CheW [Candidatus Riflebacteria bacterium]|nr:chemotaxis protein CheW [Candidatus Riflebacteria bacterium]